MKRKLKCRFCTAEGCPRPVYVDYKDLRTLKVMINRDGNLISRPYRELRKYQGTFSKYPDQHALNLLKEPMPAGPASLVQIGESARELEETRA